MTRPTGNLDRLGVITSFVGRRAASSRVKELLGTARLVTLTGPGGVGKTRLALHLAHGVQRAFRDGAWLIELAELRDPAMIGHSVVDALRLYDQAQASPEDVLLASLRGRKSLLIFDNCEHVLDTAAPLVASILRAAPDVRILATSREALDVPGEHVFAVSPLSVPDPDAFSPASLSERKLLEYESVELFAQRAAAACPGFKLGPDNRAAVARVCMRLEGMPLAIELAAVRLRALGIDQILEQLEDHFRALPTVMRGAPRRHQTLRAAVEWSFTLCSPAEQTVWARLSVFAAGFALDAGATVCADELIPPGVVVECIAALVDKSVLTYDQAGGDGRYRMLETIRQYGHEVLANGGEEHAVRRRHLGYYGALAERAEESWSGLDQLKWLTVLRQELPNLREALNCGFTVPGGDGVAGVRMATALRFLWVCGASLEGRHWLERALTATDDGTPQWTEVLWISGWVKLVQGDLLDAQSDLQRALACADRLGDDEARHHAQEFLGIVKLLRNEPGESDRLLGTALARYHDGRPWDATALLGLAAHGWTKLLLGDEDAAEAISGKCREICERLGERWAYSWAVWVLGLIRWSQGDAAAASAAFRECILAKRSLDDWFGIPNALEILMWNLADSGEYEQAVYLLAGNNRLWEPIGAPIFGFQPYLEKHDEYARRLRGALGDPRFEEVYRLGAETPRDRLVAYALGEEQTRRRDDSKVSPLTRREQQVAELVAEGMSNQDIADALVISIRTAESHVENVLTKLGFTSRAQVAAWMNEATQSVRP